MKHKIKIMSLCMMLLLSINFAYSATFNDVIIELMWALSGKGEVSTYFGAGLSFLYNNVSGVDNATCKQEKCTLEHLGSISTSWELVTSWEQNTPYNFMEDYKYSKRSLSIQQPIVLDSCYITCYEDLSDVEYQRSQERDFKFLGITFTTYILDYLFMNKACTMQYQCDTEIGGEQLNSYAEFRCKIILNDKFRRPDGDYYADYSIKDYLNNKAEEGWNGTYSNYFDAGCTVPGMGCTIGVASSTWFNISADSDCVVNRFDILNRTIIINSTLTDNQRSPSGVYNDDIPDKEKTFRGGIATNFPLDLVRIVFSIILLMFYLFEVMIIIYVFVILIPGIFRKIKEIFKETTNLKNIK